MTQTADEYIEKADLAIKQSEHSSVGTAEATYLVGKAQALATLASVRQRQEEILIYEERNL